MEEILIEVKGLKKGYKKRKTKEWVQAVKRCEFHCETWRNSRLTRTEWCWQDDNDQNDLWTHRP